MTCAGRSPALWRLVVSFGHLPLVVPLLLFLFISLWSKQQNSEGMRSKKQRPKDRYTQVTLMILVGLCIERVMRIPQDIVLFLGFDLWNETILVITNIHYISVICTCLVLSTMRLRSMFEKSVYDISESLVRTIYMCIGIIPILLTGWSVMLGLFTRVKGLRIVAFIVFILTIVLMVSVVAIINTAFVSRLSKICAARQITHLSTNISSTPGTNTLSFDEGALSPQTGDEIHRPLGVNPSAKRSSDIPEINNELPSTKTILTMNSTGSFRVFRQGTVSDFHGPSQKLLRAASKHTVLFVGFTMALFLSGIAGTMVTFGNCFSDWNLCAEYFFAGGNLLIGLCQYMSISLCNDEYNVYCQKCDVWCRRSVVFHTKQVMGMVIRNDTLESEK